MTDTHQKTENVCETIRQGTPKLSDLVEKLKALAETIREDDTVTASEAAIAYFAIREAYDELDNVRKQMYHVRDFLDKIVVPAKMEREGTDMVRIPSLARSFSLQNKMSASFFDKEKGIKWLRENGHGDLVQETVNASTLAAFVRNMMVEEGMDPPDDVVKVSTYHTIGVTKYTPKGGQ